MNYVIVSSDDYENPSNLNYGKHILTVCYRLAKFISKTQFYSRKRDRNEINYCQKL